MKCPKCGCERESNAIECSACGIVFFKYERIQKNLQHAGKFEPVDMPAGMLWSMPEANNSLHKFGRLLLLLLLAWLSWRYIFSSIGPYSYAAQSFFHNINLPFHEVGHLLFSPFGAFMHSLGGSLGQLMMPVICLTVFLLKSHDAFGASVCLWWLGESFLDLVPYIDDARSLSMPLLGGNFGHSSPYGFHDWEFILTEAGIAHLDHALAKAAHFTGSLIMITALIWMILLLARKR